MRAVRGRGGNRACTALAECIASQTLRLDSEHSPYQGITPDARNWWFPGSVVFMLETTLHTNFFQRISCLVGMGSCRPNQVN